MCEHNKHPHGRQADDTHKRVENPSMRVRKEGIHDRPSERNDKRRYGVLRMRVTELVSAIEVEQGTTVPTDHDTKKEEPNMTRNMPCQESSDTRSDQRLESSPHVTSRSSDPYNLSTQQGNIVTDKKHILKPKLLVKASMLTVLSGLAFALADPHKTLVILMLSLISGTLFYGALNDLDCGLIPNRVVAVGTMLAFALQLMSHGLGGIIRIGVLLAIWYFVFGIALSGKSSVGAGDAKVIGITWLVILAFSPFEAVFLIWVWTIGLLVTMSISRYITKKEHFRAGMYLAVVATATWWIGLMSPKIGILIK